MTNDTQSYAEEEIWHFDLGLWLSVSIPNGLAYYYKYVIIHELVKNKKTQGQMKDTAFENIFSHNFLLLA